MKKAFVWILVLAMVSALAAPVYATGAIFVPSIEDKGAPELVPSVGDDDEVIYGEVIDEEDNVVKVVVEEDMIIAPIFNAEILPEDEAEKLYEAYEVLSSAETDTFEEVPGLEEKAKEAFGEDITSEDLIIRDLFGIAISEDLEEKLEPEGVTLTLTFKLNVAADTVVIVATKCDETWEIVDNVVNNGDGTVSVTFERFCPIQFLTKRVESGPSQTGDPVGQNMGIWVAVMAVSLSAIVLLVVLNTYLKKTRK